MVDVQAGSSQNVLNSRLNPGILDPSINAVYGTAAHTDEETL